MHHFLAPRYLLNPTARFLVLSWFFAALLVPVSFAATSKSVAVKAAKSSAVSKRQGARVVAVFTRKRAAPTVIALAKDKCFGDSVFGDDRGLVGLANLAFVLGGIGLRQ